MIKKILRLFLIGIGSILLVLIVFLTSVIIYSRGYSPDLEQFGTQSKELYFINANVVDIVNNEVFENQTVEIRDGIIYSISDDIPNIPENIPVIDLKGIYLMHSLADMHTHVFDRSDLMLNLSYGVTFVRNMMGNPHHLTWRDEVNSGLLTGSIMQTASPTMNGVNGAGPMHVKIESIEHAENAVLTYIDQGYDFLKLYDGIDSTSLYRIIEIADSLNVEYAGHPPRSISNESIYALNYSSLEHVEELFQGMLKFKYDSLKADSIIYNLKSNDIPICITLSAYNHIYETVKDGHGFLNTLPIEEVNPVLRFIGTKSLSGWVETSQRTYDWTLKKYAFMEELVRKLYENDSPTLLGTDTGPNLTVHGWSIHREMKLLSDIGISNQDILLSGTYNAAKLIDDASFPGIIAPDLNANFIVSNENPLKNLESLKKPEYIYFESILFDRDEIEQLHAFAVDNFSPWYVTFGMLIDQVIKNI